MLLHQEGVTLDGVAYGFQEDAIPVEEIEDDVLQGVGGAISIHGLDVVGSRPVRIHRE